MTKATGETAGLTDSTPKHDNELNLRFHVWMMTPLITRTMIAFQVFYKKRG